MLAEISLFLYGAATNDTFVLGNDQSIITLLNDIWQVISLDSVAQDYFYFLEQGDDANGNISFNSASKRTSLRSAKCLDKYIPDYLTAFHRSQRIVAKNANSVKKTKKCSK